MNNSTDKTKLVGVGRHYEDLGLYCGGEQIKQSQNFTYPGVDINSRNLQEIEINNKIAKYNANVNA